MTATPRSRHRAGWVAACLVAVFSGGFALSVDFPRAAGGFHSDEATYYLMAYSLAFDHDLEYRAADLARGFREFPSGPSGIFLKRGTDVTGAHLTIEPPFVAFPGLPDPDSTRLYFGKSYAYPLAAAPFVRLFGTNGFLVLNAILLTAAFLATYHFAAVQGGILTGLLWAGAFVFASVVPVYIVWTMPELFNWSIGAIASVLWLYKYVSPEPSSRATRWLRHPITDVLAAVLIGMLTFSKVTNVLLVAPMVAFFLVTRAWRQALTVGAVTALVGAAAFGVNLNSSGEWNYQGGDRRTCYQTYPFQQAGRGLEVCAERSRSEALGNVMFERPIFWTNLRANLVYALAGRNSGLIAYFFPVVFAAVCLVVAGRRARTWEWFVLGGVLVHLLVFVVTQPYSYFGGGGTVGNRYFMGAYGACAVLVPMVASRWLIFPWVVGGLFVAQLMVSPFQVSARPGDHAGTWPYTYLPVELTNVNNLPIMTDGSRTRIWYGDTGAGDPGFQIYYLDGNAYLQEADRKSFWIRGESTAQVLVKTDKPYRRLRVTFEAGPVGTTASVRVGGRRQTVPVSAGQVAHVQTSLGPGFPYKMDRVEPAYVWVVDLSSTAGFVPALIDGSPDRRFLGVRVTPTIVD